MARRIGLVGILGAALIVVAYLLWPVSHSTLRRRGEAAARAGDWSTALESFRALTTKEGARARDFLGEGRALLALDRAREAEIALKRAAKLDPSDAEAFHVLMEVYRIERRVFDAMTLAESALKTVEPAGRRLILRDLTLILVFLDVPLDPKSETQARETLARWIATDPLDDDASAAAALRMAIDPEPTDPSRTSRIKDLSARLERNPNHAGLREALIVSLADAGEVEQGRQALEAWPTSARDARYDRLRGRWDLEYDHRPDEAVVAFTRALEVLPHDWKTYYRLSRALKIQGKPAEADRAAEAVGRLRERLDPASLSARLSKSLTRLDEPESRRELAALAASLGLRKLAEAWARIGEPTR